MLTTRRYSCRTACGERQEAPTNTKAHYVSMDTVEKAIIWGWGAIAKYLGIGVTTAQRYAKAGAFRIRRPKGAGPRSAVFARKSDLNRWLLLSEDVGAREVPHVPFPRGAELAVSVLEHISSIGEQTKLYRKNYVMHFDLKSSHGGVVAHIDCEYEVCNATSEPQRFVQEVTVDEGDHGYVERMALTIDKRGVYDLKKLAVSQRYPAWVAYRGPEQLIPPATDKRKYLFRASWIIHHPARAIWYNHMLLPTIGVRIETHASAGFEITESFSKNGLVMKGEHCDIQWRRRNAP